MNVQAPIRIGADAGGTFTDLVLLRGGRPVARHKLPSTPDDPGQAVLAGVRALLEQIGEASDPDQRYELVHGSTVATNAILEGKGARIMLLTTAGFEDVPWLARQDRPDLYALQPKRDPPPLAREDMIGIDERIAHDGEVVTPLTDAEIQRVMRRIDQADPEAVLVCLLHGYANPRHEQQLAAAIRAARPDLPLTVAGELLPEIREYERTATCLINAAVAPVMARYLGDLNERAGDNPVRIMGSDGGTLPAENAARTPVTTILSGPAGGVLGGLRAAEVERIDRIVTFDMGGTSTDVSLCDGRLAMTTESEIAGLPLRLPMVNIHTVGAGGGSIAWIDPGGALRVGPASSGADPGPACYGRQDGDQPLIPAVTDAHAVLGHLAHGQPLGDGLHLDADLARRAIAPLADRLGMTVERAAGGILRIAETTMARAVQRVSVGQGHDVRQFTLVSFGGAGGMHACRLAEALGMRRVLVPRDPGLLSAVGMLTARPTYRFSQTVLHRNDRAALIDWSRIEPLRRVADDLAERGRQALAADGVAETDMELTPQMDLRYLGQSYEITVPAGEQDQPVATFEAEHEQRYGYTAPDRPLELVTLRLSARGPEPTWRLPTGRPRNAEPSTTTAQATPTTRPVHTAPSGAADRGDAEPGPRDYRVIDRENLRSGDELTGPSIVNEYSATTVMPPEWSGRVTEHEQLLLYPTEDKSA